MLRSRSSWPRSHGIHGRMGRLHREHTAATGGDQLRESLPEGLMPTSVAACRGALLHRHNVIARQRSRTQRSVCNVGKKWLECVSALTPPVPESAPTKKGVFFAEDR